MSLYACVIIRENYVFLSLSANFSRYDIHHLNKATSPVPASLRWWTGSSGVSDPRTRCCLTSITGRLFIQWRLKLDGAHLRRMEILVVKLAVGCLLPVTEAMAAWREAHCGFSNNSEPNGSFESTKFSSFNPVSSNFCVCAAVQPVVREAILCLWVNSPSPKPTYALAYSDAPRDQAVVLSEIRDL